MSELLKPCPFCDVVPEIPKDFYEICFNEDCDEFNILCRKCSAFGPSVSGEWDCDGPKEEEQFKEILAQVIEAWNRRTESLSLVTKQRDELVEALEEIASSRKVAKQIPKGMHLDTYLEQVAIDALALIEQRKGGK